MTDSVVTLSPPLKKEQELMSRYKTAVTVSVLTVLYLMPVAEYAQSLWMSLKLSFRI